ncbi:MAG: (Fe-S)-binding protein [Opitutaceae bacterium]|nr:(Fe-S)-binding protein [Opitutaceae bacterium]
MSMGKSGLRSLDYSILQQCMHCGMCLPVCPTYAETRRERHSPRGRIALLRAIADGELAMNRAIAEEMNYCLGCLACTSACPAGVDYGTMVETARAEAEELRILATPKRDFIRWSTMRVLFTRPRLLRLVGRLLWLWQASGLQALSRRWRLTRLLPTRIRELEPLTPRICAKFSHQIIAPIERPRDGGVKHRVLVLTGCMQDLMFSEINRATVDVLLENGCEVHTPPAQFCCGSLHAHNGDHATAQLLARRQLDAIDPARYDAIISNAGGCGSHLRHYDRLLAGETAYSERAREWTRKLKDIHEWLVEIGFRRPAPCGEHRTFNIQFPTPHQTANAEVRGSMLEVGCSRSGDRGRSAPVTYHESCHLCHGQKVSAQPRAILRALPGVELRECAEATWCCGSAGIYNITQPRTATWLQERKVAHLRATGAEIVALANPGCHLQVANGLRAAGCVSTRVVHPIVLLAEAYAAERSTRSDVGQAP